MAAELYSRENTKIAVGKILTANGWRYVNTTPLEIMTDVLEDYIKKIAAATVKYANEFGFVQPNLEHLGLVFRDLDINMSDMQKHCKKIKFEKGNMLPQYPLSKQDSLNFLDPESEEAATRPAHIHQHLPPIPLVPKVLLLNETTSEQQQEPLDSAEVVFKTPSQVAPVRRPIKRPRVKTSVKRLKATRGAVRSPQCRY